VGTTGYTRFQLEALRSYAEMYRVSLVMATNLSIGINVLMHAARKMAAILGGFDHLHSGGNFRPGAARRGCGGRSFLRGFWLTEKIFRVDSGAIPVSCFGVAFVIAAGPLAHSFAQPVVEPAGQSQAGQGDEA